MSKNNQFYLQQDHNGLPRGLLVEECEKPTQVGFAQAMVENPNPSRCVKPVGVMGDAHVTPVLLFSDILDELHPDDPKKVGPFVLSESTSRDVGRDRLPPGKLLAVGFRRNHPELQLIVCWNTDKAEELKELFDAKDYSPVVKAIKDLIVSEEADSPMRKMRLVKDFDDTVVSVYMTVTPEELAKSVVEYNWKDPSSNWITGMTAAIDSTFTH